VNPRVKAQRRGQPFLLDAPSYPIVRTGFSRFGASIRFGDQRNFWNLAPAFGAMAGSDFFGFGGIVIRSGEAIQRLPQPVPGIESDKSFTLLS
jgi:hypothetical protein